MMKQRWLAVHITTVSSELKKTTSKTTAGPAKDNHQASTSYLKLHIEAVIESEAWDTAVQIKSAA